MDALNFQAWALKDTQPDEALALFEQARALAQQDPRTGQPYRRGLANSLVGLARLLSPDPETSARHSLQAIALLEGDPPSSLLVDAQIALGWVHFFMSDYTSALEWALRGRASSQVVARADQEARSLDLIASVHAVQGNFGQARGEHETALQMARAAQNAFAEISVLNNLAMTLLEAGDHPAALEQGLRGLDLARERAHVTQLVNAQDTVAQILVAMGDFPCAEAYLQQALQTVAARDTLSQTYLRKNLGRLYLARHDLARAAGQLEQALGLAVAWGYRAEEAECRQWLCVSCEQQGDLAGALEHHRRFHALKEAVAGAETARRLALLQAVHEVETARRDAEIERLRNAELQSEIEDRKSLQMLLELRVAERTRELRLATEAAEAANRAKTAFLSVMGHELRTPLNGIFLATDLLREHHPDLEKDGILLNAILTSGRRLQRMVEGVLEYTNVDARPGAAPLDVAPVLRDVAGAFERLAAARRVALVLALSPDLPRVCFDAQAFGRLVSRLLDNALKYTPAGGQVTVSAAPAGPGEPPPLRVTVMDTGRGLKAEDRERIFEPFVQLESSYLEHTEGAGLGLALARRQAELYGGRLWAESPGLGQGSTFVLLVPAALESGA